MAAVLISVVAVIASSAVSQTPTPRAGPEHTISVSSLATISTTPDEAVITFGVVTEDADSVTSLDRNSRTTSDVLAAMKALDIVQRDIETKHVSVSPRTIDKGTASERVVYVSSNTLSVTIHDFDAIGVAIRDGIEAGATRVRGVRFQVSDPAEAKRRALREAVQSARAKADALADAAGTSVTGVVEIRETGSGEPRPYAASRALAYDAEGAAALSIVPPRDIETQVSIDVIWSVG